MKSKVTVAITALLTSIHAFALYAPSQGRFISRDPIEEEGGLNLYAFCENDPINKVDYLGLAARNLNVPVGTVSVTVWGKVATMLKRGWKIAMIWMPPKEWEKCPPCKEAIWTQDASTYYSGVKPVRNHSWENDWNETDYTKTSVEPWIYGNRPGAYGGKAFMEDEPGLWGPLNSWTTFYHEQSFRTYLECTAGKDKGKRYFAIYWGFFWLNDNEHLGLGPYVVTPEFTDTLQGAGGQTR